MLYLCGALTSKPYAFKVRPWELRAIDSIDIFDSIGSNIRIDFKGTEILRILPKFRAEINDFWISNKIRFFFDALLYQRLTAPFLKSKSKFIKLSWKRVFYLLKSLLISLVFEYGHKSILSTTSSELNTLDLFSLKLFKENLGFDCKTKIDGRKNSFFSDFPSTYRFDSLIESLNRSSLAIILGCDLRVEAPTLNLQLRKLNNKNKLTVVANSLLPQSNLKTEFVGFSSTFLTKIYSGKSKLCKKIVKASDPVFFLGASLLKRYDNVAILSLLQHITDLNLRLFQKKVYINPVHKSVNDVGVLELGLDFSVFESVKTKNCIFWTDPSSFARTQTKTKQKFNICFSSFALENLKQADLLLPITTFVEQDGVFYNSEGRPQYTKKAISNNYSVLNLWEILSGMIFFLKRKVSFGNLSQLTYRMGVFLPSSFLKSAKFTQFFNFNFTIKITALNSKFKEKLYKTYYKPLIYDFYKAHYYCESSILMTKASELIRSSHTNYFFIKN